MKTMLEMIENYEQKCNLILKKIAERKFPKIEGRLVISNTTKNPCFYNRTKNPITGEYTTEYIPKTNVKLISRLAEKDYLNQSEKLAVKRKKQMQELRKDFNEDEFDELYAKIHPVRKEYFSPLIPTTKQIEEEWLNKPYQKNPYRYGDRKIVTRDGMRVRSKSEKFLAEIFDQRGIKYKYECPIILGNKTIYPDFTFLNRNQETIYWEHFGMMDNPQYASDACQKIKQYEKEDIFVGEKLIITFEDGKNDLDYEWVDKLINRYLQ